MLIIQSENYFSRSICLAFCIYISATFIGGESFIWIRLKRASMVMTSNEANKGNDL